LENLEKLEIPENEIESIPHEIKNLKKLKEFDLSCNRISQLPDGFWTSNSLV
jgi:Leucine-rich repeat (LRR) protein